MTTTANKSSKPARAAAEDAVSEAASQFEAFTMSMPNVEMPAVFRDFAEKGIEQARETYSKMKSAAEQTTDAIEDSYETAREGAVSVSLKALEAAQTNAEAGFAFAKELVGAKTLSEVIELQSSFARKQFDAVSGQVKELQEIARKAAIETGKPMRESVEKAFQEFKLS
jgi:phasin